MYLIEKFFSHIWLATKAEILMLDNSNNMINVLNMLCH